MGFDQGFIYAVTTNNDARKVSSSGTSPFQEFNGAKSGLQERVDQLQMRRRVENISAPRGFNGGNE